MLNSNKFCMIKGWLPHVYILASYFKWNYCDGKNVTVISIIKGGLCSGSAFIKLELSPHEGPGGY